MMRSRPDGPPAVAVRRATAGDAEAVADLYLLARRAAVPAIPAVVHVDEAVRGWFAQVVLVEREVWVAEPVDGGPPPLVALMVLDDDWLDQLYVHPARTGQGIGALLLRLAQERRPEGLTLWTFEANTGAHRFYERHGFTLVEQTDGAGNEEGAPDRRYQWRPSPPPRVNS